LVRVAQPRGGFNERIQHWLQVEGRAADDLEDIACRSLVFERFFEIARARVQFVEQPDILDRNDGLIGEGLEQIDLRLQKRRDLAAHHGDRPDRIAVLQDRHGERGMPSRLNDCR